jgi:hypothetical protein
MNAEGATNVAYTAVGVNGSASYLTAGKLGSGTALPLEIGTDGTTRITVAAAGKVSIASDFFPTRFTDWEDVASASTCDIGAANSVFVNITGTTTITSFGTATAGTTRVVKFASALNLTYNPTGMLLAGNDIAIQTNDVLILHKTAGTSGWIVLASSRTGGGPAAGYITSTRYGSPEYDAGNSGTSKTIDWNLGQHQKLTLTGNVTLTFTNPLSGQTTKFKLVQGSGPYTITWPTIKWAGGAAPTISTANGAIDIVTLYYDGTSYHGQHAKGFA